MHAVVARLTINDLAADLVALRDQIVPRVSREPRFVTGLWTRKGDNGLSMIVFDSQDAAIAAGERLRAAMPDVATLEDVELREVVGHAIGPTGAEKLGSEEGR